MADAPPLRFVVYSDYLCPWCANGSRRVQRLAREHPGEVELEWRSFLLRPQPRNEPRDAEERERRLEKFRLYTRSWERPAADEDAAEFRVWDSEEGPPSHSVPAHCLAKAAARVSQAAFERMHERLLRAYFVENRDISSEGVQAALWRELELPEEALAWARGAEARRAVLADHEEAVSIGVTGVPAVRLADHEAAIVGAHPYELYERWFEKMRGRAAAGEGAA